MITALGPRATAFARALGDVDAVIADVPITADAFVAAIARRERGEPFYGMVLYEEPRTQIVLRLAAQVIAVLPDYDRRREGLAALARGDLVVNGEAVRTLWAPDEAGAQALQEFFSLATAVLVRSSAEWNRLSTYSPRPRPFEIVVYEPQLPPIDRRPAGAPSLVLWAPNDDPASIAWPAFAMHEFRGAVTCICRTSETPFGVAGRVLAADDPAAIDALAEAHVVVCPDPHDPGAAIAFARRGYGVVAPFGSGVAEFVRDATTYDACNLRDLAVAAAIALTRPASVRAVPAPLGPATDRGYALPPECPRPPVSIIVPTYNRPDELAHCLRTLQAQTYPNLEVVVVNDAGAAVDAIVAPYAFARTLDLAENGGPIRAFMRGLAICRGTYVQILPDDDVLYPDHIERLVAAMIATGAVVAHANTLVRFQERGADGRMTTTGINTLSFNDSTLPSEALVSSKVAGHAMLMHRDLFTEIGGFVESCDLADQELQLRAAQRYVFAYVDQTTLEWRIRGSENFSSRTDSHAALRDLYERMHPVPGRPAIERERAGALANVAVRMRGRAPFPATISLTIVEPELPEQQPTT